MITKEVLIGGIYVVSNYVQYIFSIISTILLIRYLPEIEYIDLISVVVMTQVVASITHYGIPSLLIREELEEPYTFTLFISLSLLSLITIFASLYLFSGYNGLLKGTTIIIIWSFIVLMNVQSYSFSILRKQNHHKKYIILNGLNGLIYFVILSLLISFYQIFEIKFIAEIIAKIVIIVPLSYILIFKNSDFNFGVFIKFYKKYFEYIKRSVVLMISNILLILTLRLNPLIDRMFNYPIPFDYALGIQLSLLIISIGVGISMYLYPSLSNSNRKPFNLRRYTQLNIFFLVLIVLLSISLINNVHKIIFPNIIIDNIWLIITLSIYSFIIVNSYIISSFYYALKNEIKFIKLLIIHITFIIISSIYIRYEILLILSQTISLLIINSILVFNILKNEELSVHN